MDTGPEDQQPHYRRDEPEADKLDRNWTELLQELRVLETGVQILFAFLLTIAFQQRFAELSALDRASYLVALVASALATGFLIAPVAMHRMTFRQRVKDDLILLTNRLAIAGVCALLVSILSSVLLLLDRVAGTTAAVVVVALLGVVLVTLWLLWPLHEHLEHRRGHREDA